MVMSVHEENQKQLVPSFRQSVFVATHVIAFVTDTFILNIDRKYLFPRLVPFNDQPNGLN